MRLSAQWGILLSAEKAQVNQTPSVGRGPTFAAGRKKRISSREKEQGVKVCGNVGNKTRSKDVWADQQSQENGFYTEGGCVWEGSGLTASICQKKQKVN